MLSGSSHVKWVNGIFIIYEDVRCIAESAAAHHFAL